MEKSVGFQDGVSVNTSIDKQNIEMLEEDVEFAKNYIQDDKCNEWYQDFFNLAFGIDEESQEFYKEVIFPRVSQYYNFPKERLAKYQINYNALYYSLIYHCEITVNDEQEIFERLGKIDKPFKENNVIK